MRVAPGFRIASLGPALLLLTSAIAQADPLSVKELNDKVQAWKAEAKPPPPLTLQVEGRVSLYSGQRLLLRNSSIPFLSKTDLPLLAHKVSNVEATGKVVYDSRTREYTFEVSAVREVASDVERFHEKRRQLRQAPAEDWYALGEWAASRGEFYKDDDLLARSEEAFQRGLEMERKSHARHDAPELLKLAAKARDYHVAAAIGQELTHEAYRLLRDGSRNLPLPGLEELARQMARDLPGATDPLPFWPADFWKKYELSALETYAAADPAGRRRIHRLLYADVLLRTITPRLAADGSNGFEIADEIDRLIPEQHALAGTFRDRALAARAAEVEKLTRSQMLDLREQYRERGQNQIAERLIESWLTLRVRALEPDDSEALLELTEDYRRLLKRDDLADRLLIEGWRRNPKASDLVERLDKAGWRLVEGIWMTEADFASRPEGRLDKAIRAGLVEHGMTATQVRRSRGKPDSLARSMTAGQISELWTYTVSNESHLIVRFVKRPGQEEPTVADVTQTRMR